MLRICITCWLALSLPAMARAAEPCDQCRAGCPHTVHRWAKPSNTPKYSGGWVGGGSLLPADGPCPDEGTWGWDYAGLVPLKRIWLHWSHQHHQGGGGKYATDHEPLRR